MDCIKAGISSAGKLRYVANPYIHSMEEDILFHINISTKTHDLKRMFGDVKFVCMGGSSTRMLHLAKFFAEELSAHISEPPDFKNLTGASDRYVIYKVGPVLTVSHGIGIPSVSIIFNEICKLLSHAGASDVTIFRLGTSGGIGVAPGTVVITTEPVNGELKSVYEEFILGRRVVRQSILDHDLIQELQSCQPLDNDVPIVPGKTMSCNDFYEGEARVDGAICDFTQKEKIEFLNRIHCEGVRNIEMEAVAMGAWAQKVKIRVGVVCVTLLDRLVGDQITTEAAKLKEFEMRPAKVVARYMLKKLNK